MTGAATYKQRCRYNLLVDTALCLLEGPAALVGPPPYTLHHTYPPPPPCLPEQAFTGGSGAATAHPGRRKAASVSGHWKDLSLIPTPATMTMTVVALVTAGTPHTWGRREDSS